MKKYESWYKKLEQAQYNAALFMTVTIRDTNAVKLYQEYGLKTSQNRCKLRRLSLFDKIYNN